MNSAYLDLARRLPDPPRHYRRWNKTSATGTRIQWAIDIGTITAKEAHQLYLVDLENVTRLHTVR